MSDAAEELSPDLEARVLGALGLGEAPKKPEQPEAAPADAPTDAPETTVPEAEAPDNLIEIDFKGGKYKLPPELKDLHEGYLRQEDYTKKTQDVAERQRVIDLMEQQAQSQRALQSVTQPYVERLMQLNTQLGQYAQVDWGAYSDQDPTAANKHWMTYQSLKERKSSLEQEMQGAAAQHLNKLKEAHEKLKGENSKILSEKVKGWGAERDQKVRDFAVKNYGFSQQEVGQVFDARILRLMNDAFEWQTLQAAKPAIAKQAAQASKTLKPSASTPQNAAKAKEAEIKRDIRSAKTDEGKARGIQRLLERTL